MCVYLIIMGCGGEFLEDTDIVEIAPSTDIIEEMIEGVGKEVLCVLCGFFIVAPDKGDGLGHTTLVYKDLIMTSGRDKDLITLSIFMGSVGPDYLGGGMDEFIGVFIRFFLLDEVSFGISM